MGPRATANAATRPGGCGSAIRGGRAARPHVVTRMLSPEMVWRSSDDLAHRHHRRLPRAFRDARGSPSRSPSARHGARRRRRGSRDARTLALLGMRMGDATPMRHGPMGGAPHRAPSPPPRSARSSRQIPRPPCPETRREPAPRAPNAEITVRRGSGVSLSAVPVGRAAPPLMPHRMGSAVARRPPFA